MKTYEEERQRTLDAGADEWHGRRAIELGLMTGRIGHQIVNVMLPLKGAVTSDQTLDSMTRDMAADACAYLQRLAWGMQILARDPSQDGVEPGAVPCLLWAQIEPMMTLACFPDVLDTSVNDATRPVAVPARMLTHVVFACLVGMRDACEPRSRLVLTAREENDRLHLRIEGAQEASCELAHHHPGVQWAASAAQAHGGSLDMSAAENVGLTLTFPLAPPEARE